MFAYAANRFPLVSIQDQLMEFYDINSVNYNLLQLLYSWPNAISCIISGIMIDKIGLNRVIMIAFITTISGLLIMFISVTIHSFALLCTSRFMVGVGNETMRISLIVLISSIFTKNRYGIAIGFFISSIAISTSLNTVITYQIYELFGESIEFALLYPLILSTILAVPLLSYISFQMCSNSKNNNYAEMKSTENEENQLLDKTRDGFNMKHIKSFGYLYWFVILSGCLYESSYNTSINIRVSFFKHMYGYSYTLSTLLTTILSISAVITMPLIGTFSDKYGMKCKLMIFAQIIMIITHYLYGWIHDSMFVTVLTMILFGFGGGIASNIYWSSITLIIYNKKYIGTAYGIYASSIFTSVSIGYIIVGYLTIEDNQNEETLDYINVQYFQLCLVSMSLLIALIVLIMDRQSGNVLENSTDTAKNDGIKQPDSVQLHDTN